MGKSDRDAKRKGSHKKRKRDKGGQKGSQEAERRRRPTATIITRIQHHDLPEKEKTFLKEITTKYNKLMTYFSSDRTLDDPNSSLTLNFAARAFDELSGKTQKFGPSHGLIYAIADTFARSKDLFGDGFKAWESVFSSDGLRGDVLEKLVDVYKTSYDFRMSKEDAASQSKVETYGLKSSTASVKESVRQRLKGVANINSRFILARILVKLFDLQFGRPSFTLRSEKLGKKIAELGRSLRKTLPDIKWGPVFDQKLNLPEYLKPSYDLPEDEVCQPGEEVVTEDDEDEYGAPTNKEEGTSVPTLDLDSMLVSAKTALEKKEAIRDDLKARLEKRREGVREMETELEIAEKDIREQKVKVSNLEKGLKTFTEMENVVESSEIEKAQDFFRKMREYKEAAFKTSGVIKVKAEEPLSQMHKIFGFPKNLKFSFQSDDDEDESDDVQVGRQLALSSSSGESDMDSDGEEADARSASAVPVPNPGHSLPDLSNVQQIDFSAGSAEKLVAESSASTSSAVMVLDAIVSTGPLTSEGNKKEKGTNAPTKRQTSNPDPREQRRKVPRVDDTEVIAEAYGENNQVTGDGGDKTTDRSNDPTTVFSPRQL